MRVIDAEEFVELQDYPTIDAEPVIRCKDCKNWYKTYGWNGIEYTTCVWIDRDTSEDFYCAYGAKMDEVNDEVN